MQETPDPWIPLYAAGIAAMVALIVAGINAYSARAMERAKAHREYKKKATEKALEAFDEWHRRYWEVLKRESHLEMHSFLNSADNPHSEL